MYIGEKNTTAPQTQRTVLKYFAISKNVVHSLEPGETPSNSASHRAPNYEGCSGSSRNFAVFYLFINIPGWNSPTMRTDHFQIYTLSTTWKNWVLLSISVSIETKVWVGGPVQFFFIVSSLVLVETVAFFTIYLFKTAGVCITLVQRPGVISATYDAFL